VGGGTNLGLAKNSLNTQVVSTVTAVTNLSSKNFFSATDAFTTISASVVSASQLFAGVDAGKVIGSSVIVRLISDAGTVTSIGVIRSIEIGRASCRKRV